VSERERERERGDVTRTTVIHRNLRHQIYQKLKTSLTKSLFQRWKRNNSEDVWDRKMKTYPVEERGGVWDWSKCLRPLQAFSKWGPELTAPAPLAHPNSALFSFPRVSSFFFIPHFPLLAYSLVSFSHFSYTLHK